MMRTSFRFRMIDSKAIRVVLDVEWIETESGNIPLVKIG